MAAIKYVLSDDPLSDSACSQLIAHGREDDCVDFKQTFDPASDRSWINLAIDCVALANTSGGYIVIGVQDGTWKPIGLPSNVADALRDPKRVLDKINRNLNPALTRVVTRIFSIADRAYALVAVPPSSNCTHIFASNLDWTPKPGTTLTLVSKGAIYVRRAGSNQILTSTDFEELLNRRIEHFKERILQGLTRVVQAPNDEDVVTVKTKRDSVGTLELTIGSAPDGLNLEGRPLRVAVHSVIDKIRVYREIFTEHSIDGPAKKLCLEAYAARDSLVDAAQVAEWLAIQSLVDGLPAFRWLQFMDAEQARKTIRTAFALATYRKETIANIAIFYGDQFHRELKDRLVATRRNRGRQIRDKQDALNVGASRNPARDAEAATARAQQLLGQLDAQAMNDLVRLDCALFGPF